MFFFLVGSHAQNQKIQKSFLFPNKNPLMDVIFFFCINQGIIFKTKHLIVNWLLIFFLFAIINRLSMVGGCGILFFIFFLVINWWILWWWWHASILSRHESCFVEENLFFFWSYHQYDIVIHSFIHYHIADYGQIFTRKFN